jgi:uncharacterized protein (DUF2267 family)
MHTNTFLKLVQDEAGLSNLEEARIATRVVFDLLHHRITKEEAEDVEAQLPHELGDIWEGGESWVDRIMARFERQNRFNKKEFLNQVNARKGDLKAPGEVITRAVFYALQEQITPGEAKDIAAQLPKDLRELWQSASPTHVPVGGGGPLDLDVLEVDIIEHRHRSRQPDFGSPRGGFTDTLDD